MPPHAFRRIGAELVALICAPWQFVALVLLVPLPFVAAVSADLERSRCRWCGGDVVPGRVAVGAWSTWIRRRLAGPKVWTVDLPVTVASTMTGMVELILTVFGTVASVTMILAPAFHLRGIDVEAGPWIVNSWGDASAMTVTGIGVAITVAGVLTCGSFARDAVVTTIGRSDSRVVRRELEETRRNRARLLEGFESERRRIERNLHDGVQQDLLALTITLGLLDHAAGADTPDASSLRRLSGRALSQAERASAGLRDTVRGVHPRELTDHGLLRAVQHLCDASPLHVSAELWGDDKRVSQASAAVVYYAVAELLTNAAKHSGSDHAAVTVEIAFGSVVASVSDAGRGGAAPAVSAVAGSGLPGLVDRVAGVDGTLDIDSPPGAGTTATLRLPLSGSNGQRQ